MGMGSPRSPANRGWGCGWTPYHYPRQIGDGDPWGWGWGWTPVSPENRGLGMGIMMIPDCRGVPSRMSPCPLAASSVVITRGRRTV
jgi:hypothetical protein